jgi:hypothetical protein
METTAFVLQLSVYILISPPHLQQPSLEVSPVKHTKRGKILLHIAFLCLWLLTVVRGTGLIIAGETNTF